MFECFLLPSPGLHAQYLFGLSPSWYTLLSCFLLVLLPSIYGGIRTLGVRLLPLLRSISEPVELMLVSHTRISQVGSLILLGTGFESHPRRIQYQYKQLCKVDHEGLEPGIKPYQITMERFQHQDRSGEYIWTQAEGITCNILVYLGSSYLLLKSISEPVELMLVYYEIQALAQLAH